MKPAREPAVLSYPFSAARKCCIAICAMATIAHSVFATCSYCSSQQYYADTSSGTPPVSGNCHNVPICAADTEGECVYDSNFNNWTITGCDDGFTTYWFRSFRPCINYPGCTPPSSPVKNPG